MFKSFSFLTVLAVALFVTHISVAQETPHLNLKNSGSMGYIPTVTKPITSNKGEDLGTTTVTLDDNRNLSALGCGALDTHEARLSVLRESDDRLNDYFDTPVSNFMVTTLYNSPAVAQIFNGLENFSGSRVRELQDRCAAMEYKDDLAPAQWASVQACIDGVVRNNGNDPHDKVVMADAFKYCLSSPFYEINAGDKSAPSDALVDTIATELESVKWNGSLFSALANTRACIDTTNGKKCDIFAFMPNVRWCSLSNKATFKECAASNGGDPVTGGGSGDTIISPMQIFDASFGISRAFVNYAMVYASQFDRLVGASASEQLASFGENKYAKLHIANTATRDQVVAGQHGAGLSTGDGNLNKAIFSDTSFKNFMNCSVAMDNGDPVWEDFKDITNLEANADTGLPKPLLPGMIYGDFFDDTAFSDSDSSLSGVYSSDAASVMVEMATKCVMRDELRLALTDYLGLVNNLSSRDAALLGYRTQVAYAATRNILRFLIHRLELAQMDLALHVSTDPNSPPPHVRLVLNTIISSFKGRLEEMEDRRSHQKDYAAIIEEFHK